MKLYEAIELGSTLIREQHDLYLNPICGCALGTAAAALGTKAKGSEIMYLSDICNKLGELGDKLKDVKVSCPEGCFHDVTGWIGDERIANQAELGILATVSHLHFWHRWTRQRIAEWLKPIEDALEANQLVESSVTSSSVKEPVLVR